MGVIIIHQPNRWIWGWGVILLGGSQTLFGSKGCGLILAEFQEIFVFVEKILVRPPPWPGSAPASVSLDHGDRLVCQVVTLGHCWAVCSDKVGHSW